MTTTTAPLSPIDRALALAARAGVRTGAKSLKGILAAIRKGAARPGRAERRPAAFPILTLDAARRVMAPFEKGDRTDLIGGADGLVELALSAHLASARQEIAGRCVPNSYKGAAYASVAWAEARGRVVVLAYARTYANKAPRGRGVTPAHKAGGPRLAIRRADLHALHLELRAAAVAAALEGRRAG